jgi:hypothetical protein
VRWPTEPEVWHTIATILLYLILRAILDLRRDVAYIGEKLDEIAEATQETAAEHNIT